METIVSIVVAALVIVIIAVLVREHKIKKQRQTRRKINLLKEFRSDLIMNHTLEHTFSVHKQLGELELAWNKAICPNLYGMFRTKNIATMDITEVYLGNINGIWTKSLFYWYNCEDQNTVSTITNQYYMQVLSGIDAEIDELEKVLQFHDRRSDK